MKILPFVLFVGIFILEMEQALASVDSPTEAEEIKKSTGRDKRHVSLKKLSSAKKKKKSTTKKLDTPQHDSHVTETNPFDSSTKHKRCKCKCNKRQFPPISVKTSAETHTGKRDCCFPCCGHPAPTQHQNEKCACTEAAPAAEGEGGGGKEEGGKAESVKRQVGDSKSKSKKNTSSENPACIRPYLAGEAGSGCHINCEHFGPCDWHQDSACCCRSYPKMRPVSLANGDVVLGLPHPSLQLFGPPKKPKPVKYIAPAPFSGCKPDDCSAHFVPPCCDCIVVGGHKVMGLPYPQQQIDHGNCTTPVCGNGECHQESHVCHHESCCGCGGCGGYGNCGCGGCGGGCGGGEFLMDGHFHPDPVCGCLSGYGAAPHLTGGYGVHGGYGDYGGCGGGVVGGLNVGCGCSGLNVGGCYGGFSGGGCSGGLNGIGSCGGGCGWNSGCGCGGGCERINIGGLPNDGKTWMAPPTSDCGCGGHTPYSYASDGTM